MSDWQRLLSALFVAACLTCTAVAQDQNNGQNGQDGQDGTTDGDVTIITDQLPGAGVVVSAGGVLRMKTARDATGQLDRQRRLAAMAALDPELARPSVLRKVSLNRLERALAKRLAQNLGPTEPMQYLAGLTRLEYVFFFPDTGDIVIAGPAEGYMLDPLSRPVGVSSGQAILQLEDLVVALRAFGPDGRETRTVGVSIDPTREGLERMQQFLQQVGRGALAGGTRNLINGLRDSLGMQVITVQGISPNTHFANVLVEADYRMKLIGIGLEAPPVKITRYIDRADPSSLSRNALQRWYFVPEYQSVRMSDDGLAMQLVGQGVKLVNADELVRSDGTRVASGKADRAGKVFVESFTRAYPALARKAPVYAQLRNLIDMLIAAAFVQQQDWYQLSGWAMDVLGTEQRMAVEIYAAPKTVDSAVNAVWKRNVLMTPIGGGVHIVPKRALEAENLLSDEEGKVAEQRAQIQLNELAEDQWWWD